MMKTFTKTKLGSAILLCSLLTLLGCQEDQKLPDIKPKDELTVVENKFCNNEFTKIKQTDNFITAYNSLMQVNYIVENSGLSYTQILEYPQSLETRPQYDSIFKASGLPIDYVLDASTSLNESLKNLFATNKSLKDSQVLQRNVTSYLQIYAQLLEEKIVKKRVITKFWGYSLPFGYTAIFIFRYGSRIDEWRCINSGGEIFRRGNQCVCAKPYSPGEVFVTYQKSRRRRPYGYPHNIFIYNNRGRGALIPPKQKPRHPRRPRGGGGGGSYTPPKPKLNNSLKTIFRGVCSLSASDLKRLNREYKKMKQDCFYNSIDNHIVSSGLKLKNITMKANLNGAAAVSNIGNLYFRETSTIMAENLQHEWIHLFQKQHHNMSSFGKNEGMMEFEVALVQDILYFVKIGGKADKVAYSWAAIGKDEKYREMYIGWLNEMTNNGTKYPANIDDVAFMDFSKLFGEGSISYNTKRGYSYGQSNYRPYAMEKMFQAAKKNCNK